MTNGSEYCTGIDGHYFLYICRMSDQLWQRTDEISYSLILYNANNSGHQ